jgi:hypothetical protein
VKEQTHDICLAAVQRDGWALVYAREQTPEICIAAVQQTGLALKHVKEQTPEICIAAVQQDEKALHFVRPEFKHLCVKTTQLQPTVFVTLPSSVDWKEITDPITLDSLIEGEIYGWIVEKENWYLAGSLTSFNTMIQNQFKGSTSNNVFVPIKNALVPVKDIQWARV